MDTFLRLAKPICMIHVIYSILGKNCSVLVVIRGSRYFSVRVSFILLTFSLEAHWFTQPVSRTSPLEVVVRIKGIDEGQCGVSSQVLSSAYFHGKLFDFTNRERPYINTFYKLMRLYR